RCVRKHPQLAGRVLRGRNGGPGRAHRSAGAAYAVAGRRMSEIPLRCVIDTNVALTANGAAEQASSECVANSARALLQVTRHGHLFVDDAGEIVAEYMRKLNPRGQPGPGDAFLKWV